MVSSLILCAIKMPHFEQICYHFIHKMHLSNGCVLVKFDIGKSAKNGSWSVVSYSIHYWIVRVDCIMSKE